MSSRVSQRVSLGRACTLVFSLSLFTLGKAPPNPPFSPSILSLRPCSRHWLIHPSTAPTQMVETDNSEAAVEGLATGDQETKQNNGVCHRWKSLGHPHASSGLSGLLFWNVHDLICRCKRHGWRQILIPHLPLDLRDRIGRTKASTWNRNEPFANTL